MKEQRHHPPAEKLRFFSSPLVDPEEDGHSLCQDDAYSADHKHGVCEHSIRLADELPELKKVISVPRRREETTSVC